MLVLVCAGSLTAGDYDRDFSNAVNNLIANTEERRDYADALKDYNDARERALSDMLAVLSNGRGRSFWYNVGS